MYAQGLSLRITVMEVPPTPVSTWTTVRKSTEPSAALLWHHPAHLTSSLLDSFIIPIITTPENMLSARQLYGRALQPPWGQSSPAATHAALEVQGEGSTARSEPAEDMVLRSPLFCSPRPGTICTSPPRTQDLAQYRRLSIFHTYSNTSYGLSSHS